VSCLIKKGSGTGLQARPQRGTGLQARPQRGAGLQARPRRGTGLQARPRRGTGLQARPQHGAGLEARTTSRVIRSSKPLPTFTSLISSPPHRVQPCCKHRPQGALNKADSSHVGSWPCCTRRFAGCGLRCLSWEASGPVSAVETAAPRWCPCGLKTVVRRWRRAWRPV
jgi:hypothetical protein